MWEPLNIISLCILLIGFCFILLLFFSYKTLLTTKLTDFSNQQKIRVALQASSIILWISYVALFLIFILWKGVVSDDSSPIFIVINVTQNASLCSTLFFISLATTERYVQFMHVKRGQRAWWLLLSFMSCLGIVAVCASVLSSLPSTTMTEVFNIGVILLGTTAFMTIVADCVLNLGMTRSILNNRAVLESLVNSTSASQRQKQVLRIQQFKRRLISLFVLLAFLDIFVGFGAVIVTLFFDPSNPEYYLASIIAAPVYLPIHTYVLFTLLDMFKTEVLKPRVTASLNTLGDTSTANIGHDQHNQEHQQRQVDYIGIITSGDSKLGTTTNPGITLSVSLA